jgi:phosphate transport system protein
MSMFWEQHLVDLREQVVLMASLAERNLTLALRAFSERNGDYAQTVEADDSEIDQLEVQIDEFVIRFMATHAPVAKDCRLMLAATKISANLERVGDSATKIARQAVELNRQEALPPPEGLEVLRTQVCGALHEAIDAFVNGITDRTEALIAEDKQANALYRKITAELTDWMLDDREKITRCLALNAIAKTLERVGDHASNIAEEVVYLYRGVDIRHNLTR